MDICLGVEDNDQIKGSEKSDKKDYEYPSEIVGRKGSVIINLKQVYRNILNPGTYHLTVAYGEP